MRLRYDKADGTQGIIELGEQPLTIGRSAEADVIVADEKASRLHCGIRLWDGEFYARDLRSRNGTFMNGQRVEVARLAPGDVLRIGSTNFSVEEPAPRGTTTALHKVEAEMAEGKGYSTILREIVHDINAPAAKPPQTEKLKTRKSGAGR